MPASEVGMGWRTALCALAALAGWAARTAGVAGAGPGACGVAEFACRNGQCVRLDAYCDGTAQCDDGSDEPARCSPCNRTYYGRAGQAYALALGGEEAPRVPFLCHLTFTAGGGAHGELVQLAFSDFKVGRYWAGARDGCPDGYMQLAELGRPFTGGSWCGTAAGPALYYSETSTVTVSVKLFRARLGETFGLKLRYKFLAQRDAVVRFGALEAPLERGAVSPGTYCTRTYEECHRKPCRLQSPNYPGMYPRNVTCYWSLRQKDIPTCKHAMISVRQEYSHKMQIKRSISMASLNKTGRFVRAWRSCGGERDRLIVYDGASTDDPVLLEYCGGDWLPRVTARGADMLVAFHSSPYSAPLLPTAPLTPLRGFELDVDVIFADSDSLDYAREARRCEFHVKASSSEDEGGNSTIAGITGSPGRGRRGRLHAPTHTLPPNTTCTWTFHGRPGDLVWIYFSSFTHYSLVDSKRGDASDEDSPGGDDTENTDHEENVIVQPGVAFRPPPGTAARPGDAAPCGVELRVWDGGGPEAILGHYCDEAPRLCARAALANATRAPRPCAPPDGYVSSVPLLSLAATSLAGTATHPLAFALHYEFVDARLPGEPLPGDIPVLARSEPVECARIIKKPGPVWSPANALWFGRGGARRLRCSYRLEASNGRVELELSAVSFGKNQRCMTKPDPVTGRPTCVVEAGDTAERAPDDSDADDEFDEDAGEDAPRVPHLMVYESPWPGYRVPLACVCDNTTLGVVHGAGAIELVLSARRLLADEDARHLYFRGVWRALPAPCAARRLDPPGGHLRLMYPEETDDCGPLLVRARAGRSALLRVWGSELALQDPAPCETTNRVLVYHAHTHRLLKVICPSNSEEGHAVQIFTDEWWGPPTRPVGGENGGGGALLVAWAPREPGSARLAWLEVWRPPGTAHGVEPPVNATARCARGCATLGACMAPVLWCDGATDCPGGADEEAGAGCSAAARLLAVLGAGGAAGAVAGALGAALLAALGAAAWRRRRAGKSASGGGVGGGARRLTEELLFEGSRASSAAS